MHVGRKGVATLTGVLNNGGLAWRPFGLAHQAVAGPSL